METITFAEFKKLNIKVATITNAQRVEGSDKLIKISLDLGGGEQGQIAAGIAEFYEPKSLIGKQIPVLLNLEPKTFMGVESRGMMLAADENGTPVLLHPDKAVNPGSIVR